MINYHIMIYYDMHIFLEDLVICGRCCVKLIFLSKFFKKIQLQ